MRLPKSAARSLGITRFAGFGVGDAVRGDAPINMDPSRARWIEGGGLFSTKVRTSTEVLPGPEGQLKPPCDAAASRRDDCSSLAKWEWGKDNRKNWCDCKYGANNNPMRKLCGQAAAQYDPWTMEGRSEMLALAIKAGYTRFNPFDYTTQAWEAKPHLEWRNIAFPQEFIKETWGTKENPDTRLRRNPDSYPYSAPVGPLELRFYVLPTPQDPRICGAPCPPGAQRTVNNVCTCVDPTHIYRDTGCYPPCPNEGEDRDNNGNCVPASRETDVSGRCPGGQMPTAQGCVPVEYLFPNRKCPPGTYEGNPGECLPSQAAAPGGLNYLTYRCRMPDHVYMPQKGCVPLMSVPCLPGDYRDPATGKCATLPRCGDEGPSYIVSGNGLVYKHEGMPPKCVLRCGPGQTYVVPPGKTVNEGTCVDKPAAKDTGLLGKLLLGAGGGFAIGGPPGAAAGAIAAYFLLGKK